MAVRHGYGKIAGADALVFAYDTGDTRNSYKGEPTVNLAANIQTLEAWSGATSIREDAPEYGPGWKKITFTEINGSNPRLAKFPYLTHTANTTRTYSVEYDVGSLTGYSLKVDGSGGYSIIPISGKGRHSATVTTTSNWSEALFFLKSGTHTGINEVVYYKEYQVEEKSHATPFTAGTRSATQGLLDLTGNTSIDLSNVSFDSDAMFQFDGTDDRIIFPPGSLPTIGTNDFTLEFVCKNTRTDRYNHFFSVLDQYHISFKSYNVNGLLYVYRTSELSTTSSIPAYIPSRNDYYHIVAKRQGDNMQIYINGESQGLKTGWGDVSIDNNLYNSYIGWGAGTEYSGGHYAIAKIYNRALTAAEVKNNFNNYKGRFNL